MAQILEIGGGGGAVIGAEIDALAEQPVAAGGRGLLPDLVGGGDVGPAAIDRHRRVDQLRAVELGLRPAGAALVEQHQVAALGDAVARQILAP